MEKKNFSEKASAKQMIREEKKNLIAEAKANLAREWEETCAQYEGVYVFRSELNTDQFELPMRLRKVTVVGVVKKNDEGTYDLQIAWSKCHEKDNYSRKVGNMIALRRATKVNEKFIAEDHVKVLPLVLKNFTTDRLKEVFVPIATLIVDNFEDIYSRQTGQTFSTKEGFGSLFLSNVSEVFYKQNN